MTVIQWILTAGAVVGSLGVIYQTIIRPFYKWMHRIEKAITHVEMNMNNNGGTSMRDAIDRIEKRLTLVEDHLTTK